MRANKGFTLIEIMIVLVVAVVVAGGLVYVLSGSRRATRLAELDSQAQQNARAAVDFITRDLRSAGNEIDRGLGQGVVVYGGPYELIFNANIEPEPDQGSIPGFPTAINTSASPATVPPGGVVLYAPAQSYDTGAETIRYTFDSNNDGIIDAGDNGDDTIEQTINPYDITLIRQVYGFDGRDNGGANEPMALLRGPDPNTTEGTYPLPLFTYWYDHDGDASTPDILWGDTDGSGELEQGEIAGGISPVPDSDLPSITRIGIAATGTARSADVRLGTNEGYREVVISSEVSIQRIRASTASFIRGVVFDDISGDGARQHGEPGLAGVTVRLNTGAVKTTNSSGGFVFRVDPGAYTVTETDPVGYNSTTPNSVPVTAVRAGVAVANFGDRAIGGYGAILGHVILYELPSPTEDPVPTEYGVQGVTIYLDTGDRDTTDSNGAYMFLVPVSSYTISMTVPPGFLAVGPTSVDRALASQGDTVMVDFGLVETGETGTIAGKVFEDHNEPPNGIYDLGEPGIPNVMIRLSNGDSTITDIQGDYSFTLNPGTYDIEAEDLGGYVSVTPNNVTGLVLEADSVIIVNFADRFISELAFQVITLGETQRALCITSADLQEFKDPGNTDMEIILGTKYVSGISNLNVWKNEWVNQSTLNSDIFQQDPWYSRSPTEDIYSVDAGDVNGDGVDDVVCGLTKTSGKSLVWFNQRVGNKAGQLSDVPDNFFISPVSDILEVLLVNADLDGDLDVFVGTEYLTDTGRFEVWFGDGAGGFTHDASDIYEMGGSVLLGSVRTLAWGQIVGSPAKDVVLGTATGVYTGKIEIFRDNGAPNGKFTHFGTIDATGEVNAIVLRDMMEDSDGDLDILVGTTAGVGLGWLELWHNNNDGTFGVPDGLGGYEPSDTVRIAGEVLCLGVERLDADIYPDVVVGIKRGAAYSGEAQIFQTFGYLPSGATWTSPDIGEVITLTVNDFNEDFRYDYAVGTRTSNSEGHVVVFFNLTE
jgi:prepilin-type N-terminal cleavage/methylation domain-containing protein